MDSSILSFLTGVAVRSMLLGAPACAAIWLFRVKSAAARHAGFTVLMSGMLLLAALSPLLPSIPVRVLRASPAVPLAAPAAPAQPSPLVLTGGTAAAIGSASRWPTGLELAAAVYVIGVLIMLARMAFGYLFTRRLVHAARPIECAWAADVYESGWISVPLTAGFLQPRILLPAGWESWEPSKLDAVLAHERTHIRRADWAIAMLAGLNRCIYWFHPLAWWLERRLAALAEHACDDSVLLEMGARESYAQALLDMAAAVRTGQGRLVWEAMAMAKAAEVKVRIDRILDETRQIPSSVTGRRWAALAACSLPVIYLASVLQLAPVAARAQEQKQPEIVGNNPYTATLVDGNKMTAVDAARLEQYLTQQPHDLATRSKLIAYYFENTLTPERLKHVYWLIENHPESELAGYNTTGISPVTSALNDRAAYDKAALLWRQQASNHFNDAAVLANAARFFQQPGGDIYEAERLYEHARALEPRNAGLTQRLATLYARAITNSTGDPSYTRSFDEAGFAETAKSKLLNSTDGILLVQAGTLLKAVRSRPGPLGPAVDLDAHPLVRAVAELGDRLIERAQQYGTRVMSTTTQAGDTVNFVNRNVPPPPPPPPPAATGAAPPPPPPARQEAAAPPPSVRDSAPPLLNRVEPVYPPLARQARISGVVHLLVTIAPDGSVTQLQVIGGHPLLVPSAMEAVRQWRYAPEPTATAITEDVNFVLPDAAPNPLAQQLDHAARPEIPGRIRMSPTVQAAKLVRRIEPIYPALAKAAGLDGTVQLAVTIASDGHVTHAEPLSGHPLLVAASIEAVKQWQYQPTLLNATPVEVSTTVDLNFSLK